jgi:MOSC domain-containing protein YiiM
VVIVGRRTDGAPIGNYQMVRNVNNPGMAAGAYMKVIDRGEIEVPRTIEVHDGHNGGPTLTFPSALVRMSV